VVTLARVIEGAAESMTYAELAIAELENPDLTANALSVIDELTLTGAVYCVDEMVGFVPSVV
jgi:hypothetical protein